jgi:hypothetical protein
MRRDASPLTRRSHPSRTGVEANSRLTSSTAVALFFLLAVEGATVLQTRAWLSVHVFVGVVLIPPILLKMASTFYRFARYYLGHPDYREKGPPPWFLRLLGPAVITLTVVLFGSGVLLLYSGASYRSTLLPVHKLSFIAWFLVMTIHVLGHLPETFRTGLADWSGRPRAMAGTNYRRAALVACLAVGVLAGTLALAQVTPYLSDQLAHLKL